MSYPNQRYLWTNFTSPLVWDAFATYLTISVVFFLLGLVPDIATPRDQPPPPSVRMSYRAMTPQSMRGPEFPAGSVLSSSGSAWITSEVPPAGNSEWLPGRA